MTANRDFVDIREPQGAYVSAPAPSIADVMKPGFLVPPWFRPGPIEATAREQPTHHPSESRALTSYIAVRRSGRSPSIRGPRVRVPDGSPRICAASASTSRRTGGWWSRGRAGRATRRDAARPPSISVSSADSSPAGRRGPSTPGTRAGKGRRPAPDTGSQGPCRGPRTPRMRCTLREGRRTEARRCSGEPKAGR